MKNISDLDIEDQSHKIKPPPIFIIGSGRSGTTMLGEILTKAKVGRSFEGHFVVNALQSFDTGKLTHDELKRLISLIGGYESSQFFKIQLNEQNYDIEKGVSALDVVSDALEMVAAKHPSGRWIEKTPNYIYKLPVILKHFPDAKIIWVLRDGRDVAHSVFQKSWGANNIYYAANAWMRANYQPELLANSQILLVKYEELLSQPSIGLKRIFEHLDFDCTDLETLSSKINPQRMNRWKQTLSPMQIKTFEAVAYDCLKKYGYEILNEPRPYVPLILKWFYSGHHHFKLALHLFNENVVKVLAIKLRVKKPFDEKN